MAKLYFYYAAMNAGKSTTLLQSAHNYEERGLEVLLFTPKLDDRYGVGKITSRIGLEREAQIFDRNTDLLMRFSRFTKTKTSTASWSMRLSSVLRRRYSSSP